MFDIICENWSNFYVPGLISLTVAKLQNASILRDKSPLNTRFEKERNVRVTVSAMRPPSRAIDSLAG